jgi:MFS family permease
MFRTFRALRNYNFRLFWFAQAISLTGTWMHSIGQSWLVLQLTNSPVAVGTVIALQTLPVLFLALFGGVFADRVPKRDFLVFTQSAAALQALTMAILTGSGRIALWHVYVLALVLGLTNAFDNPTRQAFVVEMVGREDLPNAVALNSSLFNAARIIGPAVGGLTIAFLGISGAFYANAASFVPVVVALLLMRTHLLFAPHHHQSRNVFREVGEGLSYARRTAAVFIVVIIMGVVGTFGYNFQVTLPLIADFVLHTNAVGFGGLTSFMGIGSLIGGLALAYISRASYPMLLVGSAMFALLLFLVALSASFPLTATLLVLLGLASIAYTATANTLLQLNSPEHLRGRVMSIYFLLMQGSTPIGGFLTGVAANRIGVSPTIQGEALLCALGVLTGVWYYRSPQQEFQTSPVTAPP